MGCEHTGRLYNQFEIFVLDLVFRSTPLMKIKRFNGLVQFAILGLEDLAIKRAIACTACKMSINTPKLKDLLN